MRQPRSYSIATLMIFVAVVAFDFAVIRADPFRSSPFRFNLLHLITIFVAEIGLIWSISSPRAARAWWLGFAVFALAYVSIDTVFFRSVMHAVSGIFRSTVMQLFVGKILFLIAVFQAVAANIVGILGGRFLRWLVIRYGINAVPQQD